VTTFLFYLFSVVALGSAVMVVTRRNPVTSALFLVLSFFSLAGIYVLMDAFFLAAVQVAVYAGAIMVLFLFVIMLLGAEKLGASGTLAWQRPLAIILGLGLIAETLYVLFFQASELSAASTLPPDFGSPKSIGTMLFQEYLLPFEVTSVLLLVAMIGAIVLTRKEKA